jgi:hypothetical protein
LGGKITKKQGFFRSCVVPSRLVDAPAAPGLRRMRRAAPRPCSTWSSWRGWGGRRWLSAAAVVASERRRQSRRGKMAKTRSMQSTAPKTPPPPASISSRSPAISLDLGSDGIDFCNWFLVFFWREIWNRFLMDLPKQARNVARPSYVIKRPNMWPSFY